MSLFIIRAFVKIREDLAANAAILKRLAEIDRTLLVRDVTAQAADARDRLPRERGFRPLPHQSTDRETMIGSHFVLHFVLHFVVRCSGPQFCFYHGWHGFHG
jgi:hypothetical protein